MNRFSPPVLLLLALAACATPSGSPRGALHLANGIKIGEVRPTSAIVWVRLTRDAEANTGGAPFPPAPAGEPQLPPGLSLEAMRGAVPGAPGEVRVTYRLARDGDGDEVLTTPWLPVDPAADFTRAVVLQGLTPGSTCELLVEGRSGPASAVSCRLDGSFRTAPAAERAAPVTFCVVTGQDYHRRDAGPRGHRIYEAMLALAPDFFVHTGDTVYHDKPKPFATDAALARFKWNRVYGLPLQREFHRRVGCYFVKDDHDTLKDDCWPGQRYHALTWEQGLAIYREQLPVAEPPYRRVRWGRDLELWFVEGREQRSPNRMADGPDKTIWGAAQKRWLRETMAASDATFRVLVSPTPIVGPDRTNKNDNHANRGFTCEGDEVRRFLAGLPDTIVICGDRHWQYVSHDPTTGLREFSCGPTTDAHAGGFREANRSEMHDYLKVCGGFLAVRCERDRDGPRLVLQHRDVAGQVLHEVVLRPE